MSNYNELARRLRDNPAVIHGHGVSEEDVLAAESIVGSTALDYRRFLREFGWASFAGYEIWGLGSDLPYSAMNFVDSTQFERRLGGLPSNMIAFYNDGAGNIECFEVDSLSDEYDVFCHYHENRVLLPEHRSFVYFMVDRLDRTGLYSH